MNLFIDFDGTLIDSRARQYVLFCELIGKELITFDQYWDIKRNKISQAEMLRKYFGYQECECKSFNDLWMQRIESDELLALDKPFEGVETTLKFLKNISSLYLVTARQKSSAVTTQLIKFGLSDFFNDVFVTGQRTHKAELISSKVEVGHDDFFIGDTGEDIIAGKKLCIKSIAATYGILSKSVLLEYEPDFIIDDISDLIKIPFGQL